MTLQNILQLLFFLILLTYLAICFSRYIYNVMEEKKTIMDFLIKPIEKFLYKICKINANEEQDWKKYLKNLLIFSLGSFIFTFIIIQFQEFLPLNPEKLKAPRLDLTFNIVVSYLTNTNWQSYVPENTLSYFSQMIALTLQNFLSPAIGFCIALALIRGLKNDQNSNLGNFYKDLIKTVLYILLPICLLLAFLFVANGVPQNFNSYEEITTLDGFKQVIIGGPIASQEAIKIFGTNGGGFTLANSSHPFENPNFFTNFLQMLMIMLIPVAQIFYFGRAIKDKNHGNSIYLTMLIFFLISFMMCFYFDKYPSASYKNNKVFEAMGNLEGKEMRFSEFNSTFYSVATTTASNGATNCSLDSLEPISGLMPMLNIQLGEIIFGGIGSGLYSIILYVILAIFICGLIIGRIPEYFGKKIEIKEMKFLLFSLLIFFFMILAFTSISSMTKVGLESIKNKGPHGLSEILYAFSSTVANNGSSFSGLNANTMWYNISTGICMLVGRYEIILFVMVLANLFSKKKKITVEGSFPIRGVIFTAILFVTIFLMGIMTFLPSVVMGPVLEKFYLLKEVFF